MCGKNATQYIIPNKIILFSSQSTITSQNFMTLVLKLLLPITTLLVAVSGDHWRFIYCQDPECDCHGSSQQYWYQDDDNGACKSDSGLIWNALEFHSLNGIVPGDGYGEIFFYNSTDCSGPEVYHDKLNSNTGAYITMNFNDANFYYHAYCYGNSGPCDC